MTGSEAAGFPLDRLLLGGAASALAVALLLLVTFLVALRLGRHSVVDVAWGLGFVTVAAVTWLTSLGAGDAVRRTVVLVLVAVWGVRLAWHIGARSRGHGEDPRYEKLLSRAKGHPNAYALRSIYLLQGVILWFVSFPVQVAMVEPGPLSGLEWTLLAAGSAVWLLGFVFEAVGDLQLSRFAADPASEGRVLDSGLWRYTRHPNYFGDACVWWGLSIIAFSQWPGLLTVLSPVVMTYLLANGSGKPLLEKHMASSRTGYEDYVRRTSGFVPRRPRT